MRKILVIMVIPLLLAIASSAGVMAKEAASDTFKLEQGYILQLMSVDEMSVPRQIWLTLNHNNERVDDRIIALGENFNMYDGDTLIINATFSQLFIGTQTVIVELKDVSQYNKGNGRIIQYLDRVIFERPRSIP